MINLALYRIFQGIFMIWIIYPEMVDLLAVRNDKHTSDKLRKNALALFMEHFGKLGYIVLAASIYFYTQLSGSFLIFGIDAAWGYVFAEIILFTPIIVRRLRS